MKAVLSVIGRDTVGILAAVAQKCALHGVNITDVTQSVMQDMFVMVMMTDISGLTIDFADFASELEALGADRGLKISAMREEIFSAMHNI